MAGRELKSRKVELFDHLLTLMCEVCVYRLSFVCGTGYHLKFPILLIVGHKDVYRLLN
jgi:hypothetical protein